MGDWNWREVGQGVGGGSHESECAVRAPIPFLTSENTHEAFIRQFAVSSTYWNDIMIITSICTKGFFNEMQANLVI